MIIIRYVVMFNFVSSVALFYDAISYDYIASYKHNTNIPILPDRKYSIYLYEHNKDLLGPVLPRRWAQYIDNIKQPLQI